MGKGCKVVLVGADGCGKSTIANALIKDLDSKGIKVIHQHWRPNILPSPRVFIGEKPFSDPTRPHEKKSHPPLCSFILSVYYYFDFWLGYFFRVLPFIHKGGVMVAERYIYDMVFDPLRHRLTISEKWTRFLSRYAPSADLIVVLTGDPVILHERKRELETQEIEHQQNKILQYFKNYPRIIIISTTDQSIKTCANIIMKHILSI